MIPKHVNRWATTKPEIVVALIKELKKIGMEEISVAEGAFLDQDTTAQFQVSGMKEMVCASQKIYTIRLRHMIFACFFKRPSISLIW